MFIEFSDVMINADNVDYFQIRQRLGEYCVLGVKVLKGTPNSNTSYEDSHFENLLYKSGNHNNALEVWKQLIQAIRKNEPYACIPIPRDQ